MTIMLAAPSDVTDELRVIHEVIAEWNSLHSRQLGAVAMPLHWSTDSTPALGKPPQQVINDDLLPLSDILIAVFWTRLGSPTSEFVSGTVEEIERHVEAGKPVVVLFSDRQLAPSQMETVQYEELRAFRQNLRQRGLYDTFADGREFESKVRRHVTRSMQSLLSEAPMASNSASNGSASGSIETNRQRSPVPGALSASAADLLFTAANDPHGAILVTETLGGTQVQANGREFARMGNHRSEAQWLAAVDELARNRLIEGSPRGVSRVTAAGYDLADESQSEPASTALQAVEREPDVRVLYWSVVQGPNGAGLIVHNIGDDVAVEMEAQRLMPTGAFEVSRALGSLNPGERGSFSTDWVSTEPPAGAPSVEMVPEGKYLTRVLYLDRKGRQKQSPWAITDKRR
jgi:hypothetical protein